MTHYKHRFALHDNIAKGICNNTTADFAALFHSRSIAAEKFVTVNGFYNRLVAASAQGHV